MIQKGHHVSGGLKKITELCLTPLLKACHSLWSTTHLITMKSVNRHHIVDLMNTKLPLPLSQRPPSGDLLYTEHYAEARASKPF